MRSRMIAFIVGIASFWLIPETWSENSLTLLLLIFAIILIAKFFQKSIQTKTKFSWVVLSCIIGFVLSMYQQHLLRNFQKHMPPHSETIEITGSIVSIPKSYQNFISFRVQLDSINQQQLQSFWQPQVQLNWYLNKKVNFENPVKGERWNFNVRLKPLHGTRNPGSFDYERWAWSKRIVARGYIDNRKQQTILQTNNGWLFHWRQLISKNINSSMPDNPHLATSLLLGDKNSLSVSTKVNLQKSGLAHLLAISGLHIGMVAGIGYWIFLLLWKLSTRLCLMVAAVDMAIIFSVVLAGSYAVLSGWGIPAQRALLMIAIFSANHLFRIRWLLFDILLLSLCLLLWVNPVSILDSSGWLSFGAVFVIIALLRFQKHTTSTSHSKWRLLLKNWLSFSSLLWLCLVPFSLALFSRVPLLGWLSNIIAIPIMSLLVMPLLLLAAFLSVFSELSAHFFFNIADYVLTIIVDLSNYLAIGSIELPHPILYSFLLSMVLILWFLPRAIMPAKLVASFSSLIVIYLLIGINNPQKGARLILFDVGQGLAILWEDYSKDNATQPFRMMFDTGYGNQYYQYAKSTWLPYFKSNDIEKINLLVISHNDADHAGGVATFEENIGADLILTGQPLTHITSNSCHHIGSLSFSNTQLHILNAYKKKKLLIQKDNNQSCILLIEYQGNKILLPGDIEATTEKKLLETSQLEEVDIVIAPHHGSNTSSSLAFIDVLQPQYSLFSTGYLNRYKFPTAKVTDRYLRVGSKLLNTAEVGAIQCSWDHQGDFEGCNGLREHEWGRWHWQLSL